MRVLPDPLPRTGLLLTGGGARAAYQVGVLEAIADLRRRAGQARAGNPFPIITGTSAGAVNAAALACGCDNFDLAVRRIAAVWRNFHVDQVYQSDAFGVMRTGARWLTLFTFGWALARWRKLRPKSLLNNSPLARLLNELVPLERLPQLIHHHHLQALAITASSYSSGQHVTFYEGAADLQPWTRSQRLAVRERLTHQHLLASSAIPFVFPAIPLTIQGHTEFFGDGSMRQSAPIAPPIHLGAERILVVGAGRMYEPADDATQNAQTTYPSLAQIAGHALSNIFLDALTVDVERAQRINKTLSLIPAADRANSTLRPLELMVIAPSQRLDSLALRHVNDLPPAVRSLLGALGVSSTAQNVRNAALASYLLFEASYTRELMALGYEDTQTKATEIRAFFGWPAPVDEQPPPARVERRKDPLRQF